MACPSLHAAQQTTRSITVPDMVAMTRLADSQYFLGGPSQDRVALFSPDGRKFAVVLRTARLPTNVNDFSLLVFETAIVLASSKPHAVVRMSSSTNRDAIAKPKWLSDNRTLLFLGENPGEVSQLYAFDVETQRFARLTHHPTSVTDYDASNDGRTIVFLAAPSEQQARTECRNAGAVDLAGQLLPDVLAGRCVLRSAQEAFVQARGRAATAVPVSADQYDIPQNGVRISISPNGQYVLVGVRLRELPRAWSEYQDARLREIFGYHLPRGVTSPVSEYLLYDTESRTLEPLLRAPMFGFGRFAWTAGSRSVFLRSFLPLGGQGTTQGMGEREAGTAGEYGVEIQLPGRNYRKVSDEQWPKPKEGLRPVEVRIEEDLNTPPVITVSNLRTGEKKLLLDLNPQFRELRFGAVRSIEWTVRGIDLVGGLYLPEDYQPGRRYPLVVQTHGFEPAQFSMDGRSEWSSGFAARALAAKGIAVLQTLNFKRHDDRERVGNDQNMGKNAPQAFRNFHVLAREEILRQLDEQRLIDANRIGMVGFSRTVCDGAYSLTHSPFRYRAASLVDGIDCSYFQELAYPSLAWDMDEINGGFAPFGDGLKVWLTEASGFNLDKVATPTRLMALGSSSAWGPWEWYVGLSRLEKPVEFVLLPDATHLIAKPQERVRAEQGLVDWFCFWLKGEEDPSPRKAEQYKRWRALRELQETNDRRSVSLDR